MKRGHLDVLLKMYDIGQPMEIFTVLKARVAKPMADKKLLLTNRYCMLAPQHHITLYG